MYDPSSGVDTASSPSRNSSWAQAATVTTGSPGTAVRTRGSPSPEPPGPGQRRCPWSRGQPLVISIGRGNGDFLRSDDPVARHDERGSNGKEGDDHREVDEVGHGRPFRW